MGLINLATERNRSLGLTAGALVVSGLGNRRALTPTRRGESNNMTDQLKRATRGAAEFGAPPKTFHVGPDAAVDFGTGDNPFDGATFTHWTRD